LIYPISENENDGLFSTNFTTALAKCTTDQQMADLVGKNFQQFFPDPSADEIRIPTFNEMQPILQLLLDYLAKEKLNFQRNSVQEVFRKVLLNKSSKIRITKKFFPSSSIPSMMLL